MAERNTDIAPRQRSSEIRRASRWDRPTMLERFVEEVDSLFDDFGFGRSRLASRWGNPLRGSVGSDIQMWSPEIEMSQHNNELIVRADLPGMKKEDVSVDLTEREITISGERRQEHNTERDGFYRSERSYGSFCRTIPLPDGAMTDQAKASFKDGVLEIRMPAPPDQVTRGRRLQISESGSEQPRK